MSRLVGGPTDPIINLPLFQTDKVRESQPTETLSSENGLDGGGRRTERRKGLSEVSRDPWSLVGTLVTTRGLRHKRSVPLPNVVCR